MITKFKKFYESALIDYNIDGIINNYFVTALFTEEENELEDKTIYDFSDKAKQQAKEEIEWFINTAIWFDKDIFEDISGDKIGGNIWYGRNGHGTGFFDDIYDDYKLKILYILLEQLGVVYLEVNSDEIFFFGGSNKYKTFNKEKYYEEYQRNKKIKKYNL